MAFSHPGGIITRKSSGDMSSNQYRVIVASTTNSEDGATLVATRGGNLSGVWLDNSTETTFGRVQTEGVARIAAGDSSGMDNAITEGLTLVASSVGQAVPSTAGDQHVIGEALESLSTGSTGVIAVKLTIGALSTAP